MSGRDGIGVDQHTTPGEAMKLAMVRESAAQKFYLRCAEVVADPGVKKMFEFLAREESKHYELLEREYNRFIAGDN